jgi:ribosomal protein L32
MSAKTYEMLWDCKYCGEKKLLGLSHRHCPECGAPQDATARYFPPESEKVAVEDHRYAGSDLMCPACREVTSRAAKHCGHCGSPLEAAAEVKRVQEGSKPVTPAAAAPVAKTKRRAGSWILGLVATGVAAVLTLFLWKKPTDVVVLEHHWQRSIAIEAYGPVQESAWCDQMPDTAQDISRSREQKGTRQVPDGEQCTPRKVDNGDGTYSETQDCQTKYREEPVYDLKCRFKVDRWHEVRRANAEGDSLTPNWPAVTLSRTGQCIGCEREGPRSEEYTVQLRDEASGETHTCKLDEPQWTKIAPGARLQAQARVLTGGLDCDSILNAAP